MRKICFYLTTRGNYAKTKSIIDNLKGKVELQFILGGNFDFPYEGDRVTISDDIVGSTGLIAVEIRVILERYKPDVLVIVGDRWECLPVAMIAAYMQIPIAHIEGGELSGSIDESIRHAITKLAHVHFVSNKNAGLRIVQLGENPRDVYKVGATSFDVILKHKDDKPIFMSPFLIAIYHPVSTGVDDRVKDIDVIAAINSFTLYALWIKPNIDINGYIIDGVLKYFNKTIFLHDSYPVEVFAPLLKNASCIVGNSSAGIREASFLGTPAVNIGSRQNKRIQADNVIDVPCEKEKIIEAIQKQIDHGPYKPNYLYGNGHAGNKIADILLNKKFQIQKEWYG